MRWSFLWVLPLLATTANAAVFKCIAKSGKIIYQAQPCETSGQQSELDITADPEAEAKAQANLQMIREEYEAKKSHQRQAEKEANEQREKAAQLEYARRSAIAEQKQAEAQQRQAEALERQRSNDYYHPLWLPPPNLVIPPPPRAPREPEQKSPNAPSPTPRHSHH